MMNTQEKAQKFLNQLEAKVVGEGRYERVIFTAKLAAPKIVQDLVQEAHGDLMPNDLRYAYIHDALEILAEGGDADDIQPDVYTYDLTGWLNSHASRLHYLDLALEHTLVTGADLLMLAQTIEREETFHLVEQFLDDTDDDEIDF